MSEEGKVEKAPDIDQFLTAGVSVRKATGIAEVHADDVIVRDPAQLGASGLASSMRSPVTKSFRSGRQGGFDAAGDETAGLDQVAPLTSSRPGSMVAIISNALGEDADEENVKHFFCIPITNNVKALFVMMVMFAAISLGQYFAAIAANSQSLKADVVSMAVDALSYFGNILGESSDIPAQRVVLQLFFSMVSLVLLNYFNASILIESINIMKTSNNLDAEGEGDDAQGVVGTIVIIFAGLGLVFDVICLYAYWYYAKQDAIIEFNEMIKIAEAEGKSVEEAKASITKPEINMLTALLHVSADLMRSTCTFIEGILLLAGNLSNAKSEYVDAICGIFIGATIIAGSVYALYEWITSFTTWYRSLGNAIEVQCPECEAVIEIKPDKAGHGKAADAFLG